LELSCFPIYAQQLKVTLNKPPKLYSSEHVCGHGLLSKDSSSACHQTRIMQPVSCDHKGGKYCPLFFLLLLLLWSSIIEISKEARKGAPRMTFFC
jgi:hypothetical protein